MDFSEALKTSPLCGSCAGKGHGLCISSVVGESGQEGPEQWGWGSFMMDLDLAKGLSVQRASTASSEMAKKPVSGVQFLWFNA